MRLLSSALRGLLVDRRWRSMIGRTRYRWFRLTRGLKTTNSPWARRNTLSHNLTAFEHLHADFSMPRMERLIHAVLACEGVTADAKILVVGPRTENDLLLFWGFGYRNAIGLDLISYSPWISVGDMHALPYGDSQFDVAVCGWTLSYSESPDQVVSELIRVTRAGGLVAIGVEHATIRRSDGDHRDPRLVSPDDEPSRINSTENILGLFGESLQHCFVNIDAPLREVDPSELTRRTGLESSQCLVVASVKKSGSS